AFMEPAYWLIPKLFVYGPPDDLRIIDAHVTVVVGRFAVLDDDHLRGLVLDMVFLRNGIGNCPMVNEIQIIWNYLLTVFIFPIPLKPVQHHCTDRTPNRVFKNQ